MTGTPLTPEQQQRVVALAMDLARQGRTGELLEFLDHGLPVDQTDGDGNSLLMLAAYHGHPGTVTALIARGADVDLRNGRDQSPVAGAPGNRPRSTSTRPSHSNPVTSTSGTPRRTCASVTPWIA